jgi:acetoin utilization deacetylase AcuC-like enzyme
LSPLGRLGWYGFDAQTPVTEGTWAAALGAASCALAAARAVAGAAAAAPVAYAACRPPGHHAGRDFYGGYGFVNNAAVAARALASAGARVAIVDVDYHHGNGTQDVFYADPRVLYVSLHADPDWAYPYFWGRADETGAPGAEGATRNLPLPLDTDGDSYLAALDDALRTVASFGPDVAVVSLGTDTFTGDPVGTFALQRDSFAGIGERVARLRRPVAVVQEGGYDVESIGGCVRRFFEGLLG